ncbi:hypothetical protein [Marinobacter sp. BGYM27]|uniref:hypothetical protein n=1 Tax=Marinobacter sp. BGYM27 TaxID=2975597 RepID=UPI0021A67FEA|nr:hypothetical protein [Marinobacter sp. BGYM27]MDG5498926.1 hypothetical protein [Marinobacter sp. BGYM27]
MLVVTEKTVEVLRDLKDEGMNLAEACDYLDWSRASLRTCAIRDGYWPEISAMFPAGGSKPASDEGGMRRVSAEVIQFERPATSRWLTTAWRKTA